MSRDLQAKYSKKIKGKQVRGRKEKVVDRVAKLPSGAIASRALRERGQQNNGEQ